MPACPYCGDPNPPSWMMLHACCKALTHVRALKRREREDANLIDRLKQQIEDMIEDQKEHHKPC